MAAIWIYCGQALGRRCIDDRFAMFGRNGTWQNDNSAIRIASKRSKTLPDVGDLAQAGRD